MRRSAPASPWASSLSSAANAPAQSGGELGHRILQIEAEGGEHLVVPRAAEVDALAGLAEPFGQMPLERRVDVLVGELDRPPPLRVLARQVGEALPQALDILGREEPV